MQKLPQQKRSRYDRRLIARFVYKNNGIISLSVFVEAGLQCPTQVYELRLTFFYRIMYTFPYIVAVLYDTKLNYKS